MPASFTRAYQSVSSPTSNEGSNPPTLPNNSGRAIRVSIISPGMLFPSSSLRKPSGTGAPGSRKCST